MFNFFQKFIFPKGKSAAESQPENKEKEKKGPVSQAPLNLSVHVMPRRFLLAANQASKSKTAGMSILLVGLGLLILLGAAGYYFIFLAKPAVPSKEPSVEEKKAPVSQEATPKEQAAKEEAERKEKIEKAKMAYLDLKRNLGGAKTLDDYSRFIDNGSGGEFLSAWQELKLSIDKLSEEEKGEFLAVATNFKPDAVELETKLSGEISGNLVALTASSTDFQLSAGLSESSGSYKLTGENGIEYYDKSRATTTLSGWLSRQLAASLPENESSFRPGVDSDADGLTDKEEVLLGTDPRVLDSDNDGYEDKAELDNSYNPAGAGKLEQNPGLKNYTNSGFGYSLIYPSNWSIEKAGGEDTIIFRSPDNQFLEVLVQPNTGQDNIRAWYQAQFGAAAGESQLRDMPGPSGTVWQGIKSLDNLTIYIVGSDQEYIYVLSYSPGENETLDYANIFELMIKNFVLL